MASSLIARLVPNRLVAPLAENAGFEAVMVDMELTVVGRRSASQIAASCMSAGQDRSSTVYKVV